MSGRNAPRSKSGCQTCRQRKVKCDEVRPVCSRCSRLKLDCGWGLSRKYNTNIPQQRDACLTTRNRVWDLSSLWQLYGHSPTSWATSTCLDQVVYESDDVWSCGQDLQRSILSTLAIRMTVMGSPQYNLYATTLNSPEITCANSLTLTVADQAYFRFFPSSSVVFYYMKEWNWSSLGFLYQGPAAANKLIMRMMLAIAASDMNRRGLYSTSAAQEESRNHARYHYETAVREFRQYLEDQGTSNQLGEGESRKSEFEMIFCTMFLMITFEWHFGHSVKHLQLHLQGVRCLLKANPEMFVLKDLTDDILATGLDPKRRPSFMTAQFLLWILYMDISAQPRGLTDSLYNTLLDSNNHSLHPDSLHQYARLWGRSLWGEKYPDDQILDDIENHRPLELLHHALIFRGKIWQLALGISKHPIVSTPDALFSEMMNIRNKYSDIFLTVKLTKTLSAHRALYTMYFAVCCFYAQILFHRWLLYPSSHLPGPIHQQSLSCLLDMLYKQYSVDPKLLHRMPWSIFVVMIESKDPIHRDWAEQRLRELRNLHEGYSFINSIADDYFNMQRASPGEAVDLLEILRSKYHMCNDS